jgi:DNA-directed RNA polymerase subunit RPC12/RpoP
LLCDQGDIPMSIKGIILQEARQIAEDLKKREAHLKAEYLEAEKLAAEKKAQLDSACGAHNRYAGFAITIGDNYPCPRCAMERDMIVPMVSPPSSNGDDLLKCPKCGHMITVTY